MRKQLYVEFTKERHDDFKMIDSIDEDGMHFIDPVCNKHNELFETKLEEGENILSKITTLVNH